MGIIGENINPDLIKQIDIRQEKLGKAVLDPQDIIYNNSKIDRGGCIEIYQTVNTSKKNKTILTNLDPTSYPNVFNFLTPL